jgi:hypothetical protein
MRVRAVGVLLVATAVGCEALRPAQQPPPVAPAETLHRVAPNNPPAPKPPAEVLRASAQQPAVPTAAQVVPEDPLVLVAQCLERDDFRGATTHLETYVRAHPDQPLFRLQLAELYLRCERPAEARFHYEGFAADARGVPALVPHLVTGHIRLMELAQRSGDKFGELYHRGAGLLLLVTAQDSAKDRDALFCEEMLCKALRALTDAKELKPNDPRARASLAEALDRVGSRRAASAEREAARASVTSGGWKLE